jgi:pSer/pThr/pTyr-binding forkhead associated (FHA) protein
MKFSLLVVQGNPPGREITIRLPQFLIGRDPDCHLRPASPLVSKRHCAFVIQGDQVLIRDFGSTNGTLVNEQPVKGDRELKDGDELKIGPLHFRAKIELEEPAPMTPDSVDTVSERAEVTVVETGSRPALKPAVEPKAAGETKKAAPAAPSVPAVKAQAKPVAKPAKSAATDEDMIAEMLFNFGDDAPPSSASESQIPGSTTIMSAMTPPEETEKPTSEADKAASKQTALDKVKKEQANTQHAAAAILDKYYRRTR